MNHSNNGKAVMPERLSLVQVLCTPLSWRPSGDFERAQRAYRLVRRWEAAVARLRQGQTRLLRKVVSRSGFGHANELAALVELTLLNERLAALEGLSPGRPSGAFRFVLSSWTLRESYRYCTQDEREGLHFVLGIERDGVRIGTQLRTFPYAVQSEVAAEGEFLATHKIAIETHEAGHCLVAVIHSHPGSGRGANHPSGVDRRTQRLMELTTRCVGGIWSRDGNLRFYADSMPFEVEIIGSNMERLDDGTWQLTDSTALAVRDD